MKLSIITINYNNAAGLKKTLDSVAAQTYREFEHILIDGGSTDNSVNIIREYADKVESRKLKVESDDSTLHTQHSTNIIWVSEPDNGIYNAMNKGIEIALGRRVVNALNRSERSECENKADEIALGKRIVNSFNRSELCGDKHNEIDRSELRGDKNKEIDRSELRGDKNKDEIALGKRVVNAFNRSELVEDKNLGIQRATGEYVQILNSGDLLAAPDVTERMMAALYTVHRTSYTDAAGSPSIIYGNMIKEHPDGRRHRDTCGGELYTPESFLYFYKGTLNHDCAYIRKDLFEKYGLYNEQMKICSDWEWYVRAIALGGEKPIYTDIDVTIFDMNGVSESYGKNAELIKKERREYLEQILPASVLHDYDTFGFPILQYQRLKKYHLWGLVYFMERVLFKLEKWRILR